MTSSSPKILIVSVMQNWGGGEEFILKLAENVKGFNYLIATPEGKAASKFLQNNLRVKIINSLKKVYRPEKGWNPLSYLNISGAVSLSTASLLKLASREKPDLIIANGIYASFYSLAVAKILRIKIVVIQHLIYPLESIEAKLLKFAASRFDHITAVSDAVKENLVQIAGDKINCSVIKNGIEIPEYVETAADKSKFVFGYAGSIIREKGLDMILTAVQEALKKNQNIFFYIFGAPSNDKSSLNYYDDLKKQIQQAALEDRIIFKGFVEDKKTMYNQVDAVIIFSIVPESFSYTLVEAMSFGKIVIAPDAGGPKEIIRNEVDGFLIPPGDIEALTKRINFIIKNLSSGLIESVRLNASRRAAEEYSIDRFSQSYKKLLTSLIKK
jgi:glycosyltransferase involved in cell wall biosynthesis